MFTLQELAALTGGRVVGDPGLKISGVSEIRPGEPGTITFLTNPRYKRYASTTRADAILTSDESVLEGKHGLLVSNPRLAVAQLLEKFRPPLKQPRGIHPSAVIAPGARLGKDVAVGAHSVIEEEAEVGAGSILHPQVVVEQGASLGKRVVLHPFVQVYHHCVLGNQVLVHSGTVIGSDGFGFVTEQDRHHKIPQNGRVVIGDRVEIGAGCTFDRGTVGDTVVGPDCKFDNLVHVAHNVKIGRGCLITAQVAFAGSAEIGKFCIFAGQSGVAPHVRIGDRAIFAAKSGATKSLPGGKVYAGMPAREIREQNKRDAALQQIEAIVRRLKALENRNHSAG